MSEYLIMPVMAASLETPSWVSWTLPSVAALMRIVPLVETPLQARAIAGLPCSLRLGHYLMADVELRHLEDPMWLREHAGHHLVLKTGEEVQVGLGQLTQSAWRVKEISLLAILRLPPPCYTPREAA